MKKITLNKLKNNLSFKREDYEKKRSEGIVNFNDFLKKIIEITKENKGTLNDAIFIAEDAFEKL